MSEQNFEHEDRYAQQNRRPQSSSERRSTSRGYLPEDDRYESERNRYRSPSSDRRYTRPDYESDLDIERPGQPRFSSSSRSYDAARDYDQDASAWNRPSFNSQSRYQDRSSDNQGRFNETSAYRPYDNQRNSPSYGRDFQNSNIGHADWSQGAEFNRYGSDYPSHNSSREFGNRSSSDSSRYGSEQGRYGFEDQNWNRRYSADQGSSSQHHNEQKHRWPKSYKRTDERLKDDIHEELIRHGRIDASEIEVQVKDGEVVLTGQVSSRQDKRIAEELAEKVLGVSDVQNQLRVSSKQGSDSKGNPSLPGSNRMSVASQQSQQEGSKAVNSSNK